MQGGGSSEPRGHRQLSWTGRSPHSPCVCHPRWAGIQRSFTKLLDDSKCGRGTRVAVTGRLQQHRHRGHSFRHSNGFSSLPERGGTVLLKALPRFPAFGRFWWIWDPRPAQQNRGCDLYRRTAVKHKYLESDSGIWVGTRARLHTCPPSPVPSASCRSSLGGGHGNTPVSSSRVPYLREPSGQAESQRIIEFNGHYFYGLWG